jgi:CRP-like cAMP-binding protein
MAEESKAEGGSAPPLHGVVVGRENEVDVTVKNILMKLPTQRTYDEILVLKRLLESIEWYRVLLRTLMPSQISELCRTLTIRFAMSDTYVFKEGDEGDNFFALLGGECEVRINRTTAAGEVWEETVHKYQPGGSFGERALEQDEPRAASIYASRDSTLLVLSRKKYTHAMEILNETSASEGAKPGTKAYCLRTLGKKREDREPHELVHCVAYLEKRVAFFKKFNQANRLELVRACELVSFFGKTTVFKQGAAGAAFYILLNGTCQVIVQSPNSDEGIIVNTLHGGAAFGERALESSEGRTATIVTGVDVTELLVLATNDYKRFIADIYQKERRLKVALLRSTHYLGTLSDDKLEALAKYMEPKQFLLDSAIFEEGKKAKDIVFISTGECNMHLTIHEVKERDNKGTESGGPDTAPNTARTGHSDDGKGVQKVDLCRVGPGAVLADYIALSENFLDDVHYKETVVCTTIVAAYVIAKYDFFFRVPMEVREAVRHALRHTTPPLNRFLFENTTVKIGQAGYTKFLAWREFRSALLKNNKAQILDTKRNVANLMISEGEGNLDPPFVSHVEELAAHMRGKIVPAEHEGTLAEIGAAMRHEDRMVFENSERLIEDSKIRSKKTIWHDVPKFLESNTDTWTGKSSLDFQATGPKSPLDNSPVKKKKISLKPTEVCDYPFSVIHIHRETIKKADMSISRRPIRCFMRCFGSMPSCLEAKKTIESTMACFFVTELNSIPSKADDLALKWRAFTSIDSLPVHFSDFFLVYCRSAIIEYCCISPVHLDLLSLEVPPTCRPTNQKFGCLSTNSLRDHGSSEDTGLDLRDAIEDMSMSIAGRITNIKKRVLVFRELQVVFEVMSTSPSELDCVRYAKLSSVQPQKGGYIICVPLYDWILVSDAILEKFGFSYEAPLTLNNSGAYVNTVDRPMKQVSIVQSFIAQSMQLQRESEIGIDDSYVSELEGSFVSDDHSSVHSDVRFRFGEESETMVFPPLHGKPVPSTSAPGALPKHRGLRRSITQTMDIGRKDDDEISQEESDLHTQMTNGQVSKNKIAIQKSFSEANLPTSERWTRRPGAASKFVSRLLTNSDSKKMLDDERDLEDLKVELNWRLDRPSQDDEWHIISQHDLSESIVGQKSSIVEKPMSLQLIRRKSSRRTSKVDKKGRSSVTNKSMVKMDSNVIKLGTSVARRLGHGEHILNLDDTSTTSRNTGDLGQITIQRSINLARVRTLVNTSRNEEVVRGNEFQRRRLTRINKNKRLEEKLNVFKAEDRETALKATKEARANVLQLSGALSQMESFISHVHYDKISQELGSVAIKQASSEDTNAQKAAEGYREKALRTLPQNFVWEVEHGSHGHLDRVEAMVSSKKVKLFSDLSSLPTLSDAMRKLKDMRKLNTAEVPNRYIEGGDKIGIGKKAGTESSNDSNTGLGPSNSESKSPPRFPKISTDNLASFGVFFDTFADDATTGSGARDSSDRKLHLSYGQSNDTHTKGNKSPVRTADDLKSRLEAMEEVMRPQETVYHLG